MGCDAFTAAEKSSTPDLATGREGGEATPLSLLDLLTFGLRRVTRSRPFAALIPDLRRCSSQHAQKPRLRLGAGRNLTQGTAHYDNSERLLILDQLELTGTAWIFVQDILCQPRGIFGQTNEVITSLEEVNLHCIRLNGILLEPRKED